MHITESIRRTIKAARIARGLTHTDLASLIGVTRPTISYIESGDINPSVETLDKLCRVLGIRAEFTVKTRHKPKKVTA